MVLCIVVGCSNRSGRDKDVSFHRIPAVNDKEGKEDYELRKRRRDGFLAAISRKDIDVNGLHKYRICSRHFISGEPAALYDQSNPDWLPTLNLGYDRMSASKSSVQVERWQRARERDHRRMVLQEIEDILPSVTSKEVDEVVEQEVLVIVEEEVEIAMQYFKPREVSVNCECSSRIESLEKELADSKATVISLSKKLVNERQIQGPFTEESMAEAGDDTIKFYTALPNFKILKAVYDHTYKTLSKDGITKLTAFQEFMCTMLKLRMNTPMEDLAYRFRISVTTVSRIFLKWLRKMDLRLQDLIIWPDRDVLQKTMPVCFQTSFGKKVAVIIDCFEIFIDKPSNLSARASTWSNYKHHNTAKVLLGISPQGVVSFVSECWGGRVSDKYLTEHCGILKKLLPGDIVLADRGFDIAELVAMMQAQLHIPAFT